MIRKLLHLLMAVIEVLVTHELGTYLAVYKTATDLPQGRLSRHFSWYYGFMMGPIFNNNKLVWRLFSFAKRYWFYVWVNPRFLEFHIRFFRENCTFVATRLSGSHKRSWSRPCHAASLVLIAKGSAWLTWMWSLWSGPAEKLKPLGCTPGRLS